MSRSLRIEISQALPQRPARLHAVDMFDKTLLLDDAAIESATSALDIYIAKPATDKDELINQLEFIPYLLEFWLSSTSTSTYLHTASYSMPVVNDYSFSVLNKHILCSSPSSFRQFDNSLSCRLLHRFSLAFIFIPYGVTSDVPTVFNKHRRTVELATSLLRALVSASLDEDAVDDDESTSPPSPTMRRAQRRRQQSRRASRASTRSMRSPVMESKPFVDFGVQVPSNGPEANHVAERVMLELRDILQVRRLIKIRWL